MLDIRDTLACVELAVAHPAEPSEFRVFNQFTESFSIRQLAQAVVDASPSPVAIAVDTPNPRVEKEEHHYRPAHTKLLDLGLVPHLLGSSTIESMLTLAERHRSRVDANAIAPTVDWRSTVSSLATTGTGEVAPV
jgi:UDP-sulfoquinovose synthase